MYKKIEEFCGVKNIGGANQNGTKMPNRVKWIKKLLEKENIPFEIDSWQKTKLNSFWNIILPGTDGKFITAHHDIVNAKSDNANDNSASVINAIMTKVNSPNTTVILLDGEEIGGVGSERAAKQIKLGYWGECDFVLNYELTGRGGKYFFVGDYEQEITEKIFKQFGCPKVKTPFNDSVIFQKHGINSTVINPLPPTKDSKSQSKQVLWNDEIVLDYSLLYNCHSMSDSLETIDIYDMKDFVENVVLEILK